MKRTFIAIKIPLSRQSAEIIDDVKEQLANEKIKWVDMWNMHITLHFLGDTDETMLDDIGIELKKQLKGSCSFTLQCTGLGLFKNIHNPKVLWFGIDRSDELTNIKERVDNALKPFGFFKEGRMFKPHLTIGRVRFIKDKNTLSDVLEEYKNTHLQDFNITEVLFYESELTPKGPIYKVIQRFHLD
jgi:2'-5' RNA ligase